MKDKKIKSAHLLTRIKISIWNTVVRWLLVETNAEALSPTNFPLLVKKIRPADVLLVEGRHRVSNVIRLITHSPWTHSALYIGRIDDIRDPEIRELVIANYQGDWNEPLVIESELGPGTLISPVSKYKRYHIRICRPKGITEGDVKRVIAHAVHHLGMAYDVRQLLDLARFMFPFWTIVPRKWRSSLFEHNAQAPTSMVCSSMIASAFYSVRFPILPLIVEDNDGGYKLYKRNLRLYTPRDFDYSPYFEIIKYPLLTEDDLGFYRKLVWDEECTDDEGLCKYIESNDILRIKEEILKEFEKGTKIKNDKEDATA